jgi:hypothetical protein
MAGSIDTEIALRAADDVDSLPLLGKLHEWVVTVDHKRLGIMYIVGGLFFLVIAGLQAMTIRLQLAIPDAGIVPPQVFNRLLTMHGTAMVFLVGMPILVGFFNYLVPLMIGARSPSRVSTRSASGCGSSAHYYCTSAISGATVSTVRAAHLTSDGSRTHR